MFNHEAIDFQVEKFPLVDVPTDIGVGFVVKIREKRLLL